MITFNENLSPILISGLDINKFIDIFREKRISFENNETVRPSVKFLTEIISVFYLKIFIYQMNL